MKATDVLEKAAKHMRDRAATYDKPEGERSMSKTVAAFNAITGKSLSVAEGWQFMAVLKQVRAFQNPAKPHQDSLEDGVAYAALMAEEMLSAQPAPFTAESIGAITAHGEAVPVEDRNCESCIRYVKNRCVVSSECGKYTLWSPR